MKKFYLYTFEDDLAYRLKNPAFKKEWEDSELERQLSMKLIEARLARKMTQSDLAAKVKTSQAAISRIEAMNGNPSLAFLKRVAEALDSTLSISFTKKFS